MSLATVLPCYGAGVFVKTTRRHRGDKTYEYLSLVESVRDGAKTGHRTLLRLGEVTALRRSGRLDRIVAALQKHLETEETGRVEVGSLKADGAPAVGGVACAAALWERLGLHGWFAHAGAERDADRFGDAVFAMAANRLVAPGSKGRLAEWARADVVMPEGWEAPSPWQYYRALDIVAGLKEATEEFLFPRLCDLTNIDLKFVCYDLTSTYLEGATEASQRFGSKRFGYSRDRRADRPQVVIGLLCTGDGVPIAHHVFAGNTADASTLPSVLADLTERFAVGRICVVADRGLISAANVAAVAEAGCDHVLATRLHRDKACREALETITEGTEWADVPGLNCRAVEATLADGTRAVIVESDARARRDTKRTAELVARTETALLAGRYVLTTRLTPQQAPAERVVAAYRQLADVEARFGTLKDLLRLRPIRHWTEQRVRGHIAVCVYAAVAETLITRDLAAADIADPDQPRQHLTAARALRELDRIREVRLHADRKPITLTTRPSPLQTSILAATRTPTRDWDKARIG